jgi:hypothetical protein
MKESELYNQVSQKVREFETLADIEPSYDWNQSLMDRISNTTIAPSSGFSPMKSAAVLVLVVLVNVGIILTFLNNDNTRTLRRGNDLKKISTEFLINPTSISE